MFTFFLILWIILNGRITLEILLFGVVIAGAAGTLTLRLFGLTWQEDRHLLRQVPLLAGYVCILVWEIIKASLAVIKMAWSRTEKPDPIIMEFHSGLPADWQNVLLANSITLTPGTYTVFQEGDRLVVHSLCPAYAQGIEESSFVRQLRRIRNKGNCETPAAQ